jgi:peptidoglycan/LPS O-acetylase OafA/YrhL
MRLRTYSRSAEIARAGLLAVLFVGVGTLAFAFAPGSQQAAPPRQALVVAKPTLVAVKPPRSSPRPSSRRSSRSRCLRPSF